MLSGSDLPQVPALKTSYYVEYPADKLHGSFRRLGCYSRKGPNPDAVRVVQLARRRRLHPLVVVSLLIAEAYVPRMDRLTLAEPQGVRTTVANLAMSSVGFGKESKPKIQRVLRLDPANPEAQGRRCTMAADEGESDALSLCTDALKRNRTAPMFYSLGKAQEAAGDPCAAEQSFTSANSLISPASAFYLRNMGRAAYACGSFLYSVAEFSAVVDLDTKSVADPNQDAEDLDDAKEDLVLDREWLVVAYRANAQPKLASQVCAQSHPGWKACNCTIASGKVSCTDSAGPAPR